MRRVRAERVVLAVVAVILLFIVVCPPFEYRGRWVHLWLREGLRLAAEWEARFCARLLLMELAALGAAVGLSLVARHDSRRRSGGPRLTRSDRVLVMAILAVVLLFLFPPFRVEEESSWVGDEYVTGESHVAHRIVTAPHWDGDEFLDVHLELLVGEVAVVVVAAAVLMVLLRTRPTRKHER